MPREQNEVLCVRHRPRPKSLSVRAWGRVLPRLGSRLFRRIRKCAERADLSKILYRGRSSPQNPWGTEDESRAGILPLLSIVSSHRTHARGQVAAICPTDRTPFALLP